MSFPDTDIVKDVVEDFPFTVSIAYTDDETNWFADMVLPDNIDFESLQLKELGGHSHGMDSFWEHRGYALKQPVVDPQHDTIEMTDLWTELMDELGRHDGYLRYINRGYLLGVPLATDEYNFSLDPDEKHTPEEIWDRVCRAETTQLSDGEETKSLEWFAENGFYTEPFARTKPYLHHVMADQDCGTNFPTRNGS